MLILFKRNYYCDDCSNDKTTDHLQSYQKDYKIFYHDINLGRGAAIKTGKNLLLEIL